LNAILGPGYFARAGGHVLIFGAGGAAAATLLHLVSQPDPADRPARIILVDILPERLAHIAALAHKAEAQVQVDTLLNTEPRRNDALMAALPPHSLVINATGMGKDIPGSPITNEGIFPMHSVAWEFNYRGELAFLRQAQRQARERRLTVEDGWLYFLHGWKQVISQVLHIDLEQPLFARLQKAAEELRHG
jgi:shikimate dehydrogenase